MVIYCNLLLACVKGMNFSFHPSIRPHSPTHGAILCNLSMQLLQLTRRATETGNVNILCYQRRTQEDIPWRASSEQNRTVADDIILPSLVHHPLSVCCCFYYYSKTSFGGHVVDSKIIINLYKWWRVSPFD